MYRKPKIKKVLDSYDVTLERLKEIFQLFVIAGIGEKKAWSIIKNPKKLDRYFKMEVEGIDFPEIITQFL